MLIVETIWSYPRGSPKHSGMPALSSFSRAQGLESGLQGENICSLAYKIHLLTEGVKQVYF